MAARVAFVALMIVLSAIRYYYYRPYEAAMSVVLYPAIAGFAALTLARRDTYRRLDLCLLVFFMAWTMVASLWNYEPELGLGQDSVYHVIFFALVCYPVAILHPGKDGRRAVHGILHVFCLCFALLCVVGIVAVVLDTNFLPLTQASYPMGRTVFYDDRLSLFMHPNLAAGGCCLTFLLALYMILYSPRKMVKIYYIVVALVAYVALALTDSRTSILATCAGVGVLGFVVATRLLRGKPLPLQWGGGIAGLAALAVVCYFGFSLAFSGINGLVNIVGGMHASAEAPMAEPGEQTAGQGIGIPAQRDLTDGLRTGNGRSMIWQATVDAIKDQPMILLRGTSNERVSRAIAPYIGYHSSFDHVHNSFLQVLIAVGVPGLLALVGFLVYLCRYAGALTFSLKKERDLAARFLPSVLLAMLVIAMSETMFFMTDQWLYDSAFFLVAGLVVSLGRGRGHAPEAAAQAMAGEQAA